MTVPMTGEEGLRRAWGAEYGGPYDIGTVQGLWHALRLGHSVDQMLTAFTPRDLAVMIKAAEETRQDPGW